MYIGKYLARALMAKDARDCECVSAIWLVGCFGFSGSLRQYFSLYRAVFQREGKRGERIEESKNVQTTPHPHLLQAQ